MDLKEIQTLIKFVSQSGVDEVELERKDFKLVIKKAAPAPQVYHAQLPAAPAPAPAAAPAPAPSPAVSAEPAKPAAEAPAADNTANLLTIKSPMIGTFYRSAGPDKPPFINVGDEVKTGQVVCIIEAMKLFNEIESEISGRIVKILVEDSSPVEYDQPLMLVEPL